MVLIDPLDLASIQAGERSRLVFNLARPLNYATIVEKNTVVVTIDGSGGIATAVNAAGILTAMGILILSLVMLKGVFHKGVAYLGIATGAIGIISEALRPIIGPGYYIYGLLLPIWFVVVGWKLYRLARD